MVYPVALAVISVVVALAERLWPWRPAQRALRAHLLSDVLHLVFNGHFLGLILYGIAVNRVLPGVDGWLASQGWLGSVYRDMASGWPLLVQIGVALVVVDFLQWCVHNLLHRVGFLWSWHKVHHSVKDGEMDWIVSFRFQWTEVVLYKALLYLPLAWLGFAGEALLFHAIFGTLIGHLNHANLDIDWGPGKYLLNSPRMHIWHHDHDAPPPAYNFGIIFSCWDWIFGTAYLPDHPPRKLGYPGVEEVPPGFFQQSVWQLGTWLPPLRQAPLLLTGLGGAALAMGWLLHLPPRAEANAAMLGEQAASSQPTTSASSARLSLSSPAEAEAALGRLGEDGAREGHRLPSALASAREVAAALGSPRLVLLDVRPPERVAIGRIPSARPIDRPDYSTDTPAPGVSQDAASLQALLRANGVDEGDVVVLYGDGDPEPYRLWWTLRVVAGLETRVLDGGLTAWKALGGPLAEGPPRTLEAPGTLRLTPPPARESRALLWADLEALLRLRPGLRLIDTRTLAEFTGAEQHPKAARAGRIPGAQHLDWTAVLRTPGEDDRLQPPAVLDALLSPLRGPDGVVTYCQSGTRSAAVYFAMLQLGWDESQIWNYDGSWAEYSRQPALLAETGPIVQAGSP